MNIYNSPIEYTLSSEYLAGNSTAVTLGKFDGLHLGHQKLLARIIEQAKLLDIPSAVFAIEVNRDSGSMGEKFRGILTPQERAEFLESMGIDSLIVCPFSKKFMEMTAQNFISLFLCGILHASYIAVGTDFRFGYKRGGEALTLKRAGCIFGYTADIIEKEKYKGVEISSSRIRTAILAGDMDLTSKLLGRAFSISGIIMHGSHIGTGLGMPTINITPPYDKLLPPDGVYVSLTRLPDGRNLKGVTNIGTNPTVGGTLRGVETTLFDFDEDLYGIMVKIQIVRFLRREMRFPSLAALREQVERDKAQAEEIFSCRSGFL